MRLFIALTVPEHVTERLAREQERLSGLGLPFRWVSTHAMHLTLVFLGETPEALVANARDALTKAASGAAPLAMGADGVGTFPPRGTPHVVWAGISGDRASLTALQAAVAGALRERKITFAARHFAPHITLGRLGSRPTEDVRDRVRRVDAYCVPHKDFGAWTADEVHLVQSELRPEGARYTTLYTCPLKG